MDKLSDREWYVLNEAYKANRKRDGYGYIITRMSDEYSIAPATCKALVRKGLLSETGQRNKFYITSAGIALVGEHRGEVLVHRVPLTTEQLADIARAKIEAWNKSVRQWNDDKA